MRNFTAEYFFMEIMMSNQFIYSLSVFESSSTNTQDRAIKQRRWLILYFIETEVVVVIEVQNKTSYNQDPLGGISELRSHTAWKRYKTLFIDKLQTLGLACLNKSAFTNSD